MRMRRIRLVGRTGATALVPEGVPLAAGLRWVPNKRILLPAPDGRPNRGLPHGYGAGSTGLQGVGLCRRRGVRSASRGPSFLAPDHFAAALRAICRRIPKAVPLSHVPRDALAWTCRADSSVRRHMRRHVRERSGDGAAQGDAQKTEGAPPPAPRRFRA
jgi:hypothetical protein